MNIGESLISVCRVRIGSSFRKKLGVYHYKIGHTEYHKFPGVVPLHIKEKLKKVLI